jgi:hypothetical protein
MLIIRGNNMQAKNTATHISITIPADELNSVKLAARRDHRSVASFVRQAIAEKVERSASNVPMSGEMVKDE